MSMFPSVWRRATTRCLALFSIILSLTLLLINIQIAVVSAKDIIIPPVHAGPFRMPLPKDVRLAWPAVGHAAVGSVEDGLLSRSSNNEEQRPTASMAKIITALAIMKKQPFEPGQSGQLYTLTSQDVAHYQAHVAIGGSVIPVRAGMELTQYQAMQLMLLASANNIADTLVEKVFGSTEAYLAYTQDMLQTMGLSRTVMTDPTGFSATTISTPSELVAIGIAALQNPVIAEIVAQPKAHIPGVGDIKNTNQLLGTEAVIGIKTGTTGRAGSCLLFAARYVDQEDQKSTLVGVIMGEANATSLLDDSKRLLASAKEKFGLVEVRDKAVPANDQGQAPRSE